MRELGFQYLVPRMVDEPSADIPFTYGNDDVDFAVRHPATVHRTVVGGVVDLAEERPEPPEPAPGLQKGGSRSWREALYGTGDSVSYPIPGGGEATTFVGGCSAQAIRETVGPDVKRWLVVSNTVEWLDGEVAGRVQRLPEYVEALAGWEACVGREGYRPSEPGSRALDADPKDGEANRVNAECGAAHEVQATGERLERTVRPVVYREHESAIIDYNAMVTAALERVARD